MATNKKYDIVETSKMAVEYDGSLIEGTKKAKVALENGRLARVNGGEIDYANTTDEVLLIANTEMFSQNFQGLTEFRTEQGEMVRVYRMRKGDEFKTTAIEGTIVLGDKVGVGTNGQLKKVASPTGTENFLAEVIEVGTLGFSSFSFGMDEIPAIRVKVINA